MVVVGACTRPTVEDEEEVEPPELLAMPASFSAPGERVLPDAWWTDFGDRELNVLVESALAGNFDLAVAWQRLVAARALVEREASVFTPELDAFADADAQRPTNGDSVAFGLGLSAFYEIDLWGRFDSLVAAEEYRARASLADYQTAALSLSAGVTQAWYGLLEARAQRALLIEQIETNEQVLQLIRARVGIGQIRGVDILRQERLIESTRTRLIDAQTRVEVLEHLLDVLLGRPPQLAVEIDSAELPTLPQLPPLPATGLPAELVQRRPDLQARYLLLRAADEDVAAAVSSRYPRLSLSASLSTNSDGADDLFQDWIRRLAANLVVPLIDGDRRDADIARAEALAEQRLFEYAQATLQAFQEVEDALVRERQQRERIASLEQQQQLAERTYEQLRSEYFNGLADYIDVLTTLSDLQETRRSLVSARLALVEARIALCRALAGGFETEREKEEQQ